MAEYKLVLVIQSQKKTRTTHISELVAKCFLTFRLNSLLTLISCIELCNLKLTQNVSQS